MTNLTFTYPVREVAGAFQGLGLICTAWRVYFRLKIGRFWWEDAWSVVACVACMITVAGEWMCLLAHDVTAIAGFWFNSIGFTFVVRGVQMSILFSIIRIVNPNSRLHKFTHACVGFFALCMITIIIGKVRQCTSNLDWHHNYPPACLESQQILIFEFVTDCLAVGILIAVPFCMLWKVKLPRAQRRMILSIFASSSILALAAIPHIVGHITANTLLLTTGVNFEIALNMIVCNLLVIVTFVYRFLLHGESDLSSTSQYPSSTGSDDFTQPRRRTARTALTMTTIEDEGSLTTTCPSTATDTSPQSSAYACM